MSLKRIQVKTDQVSMRSVFELIALYQCQFPGFDNVLWLRYYHWQNLEEGTWGLSIPYLRFLVSLKPFPSKSCF